MPKKKLPVGQKRGIASIVIAIIGIASVFFHYYFPAILGLFAMGFALSAIKKKRYDIGILGIVVSCTSILITIGIMAIIAVF